MRLLAQTTLSQTLHALSRIFTRTTIQLTFATSALEQTIRTGYTPCRKSFRRPHAMLSRATFLLHVSPSLSMFKYCFFDDPLWVSTQPARLHILNLTPYMTCSAVYINLLQTCTSLRQAPYVSRHKGATSSTGRSS